jgi:hypothetical protein
MLGSSWVAAQLATLQEGFSSMNEWTSYLVLESESSTISLTRSLTLTYFNNVPASEIGFVIRSLSLNLIVLRTYIHIMTNLFLACYYFFYVFLEEICNLFQLWWVLTATAFPLTLCLQQAFVLWAAVLPSAMFPTDVITSVDDVWLSVFVLISWAIFLLLGLLALNLTESRFLFI